MLWDHVDRWLESALCAVCKVVWIGFRWLGSTVGDIVSDARTKPKVRSLNFKHSCRGGMVRALGLAIGRLPVSFYALGCE